MIFYGADVQSGVVAVAPTREKMPPFDHKWTRFAPAGIGGRVGVYTAQLAQSRIVTASTSGISFLMAG